MDKYGFGVPAEQPSAMTQFWSEVDQLKRELETYKNQVSRIDSVQQRILIETSTSQLEVLNGQVAQLTDECRAQARELRSDIQLLLNKTQHSPVSQTHAENLREMFKVEVQRYQQVELAYRQKHRGIAERQYRTVCPEASEEEVRHAVSEIMEDPSGNNQIFRQALMSSSRRGEAQTVLNEVQARHTSIQQIAKTMEELAQLFQDLETMVAEQEEAVQFVNQNVEVAQRDLESGGQHINKAIDSARSARRKKWKCLGLAILIVLVIGGIAAGAVCGTGHCS